MCLRSRESPKKTQRNGQQWIRSTGGGGVWGVPYILLRHIIVRPCQAGTLVIVYIVCLDTTSIIRNRTFVLKPHLLVATSAWQPGIFVRKDRKRNGNSQKMLRVSLTLIIITSFNIVTSSKGKKYPDFVENAYSTQQYCGCQHGKPLTVSNSETKKTSTRPQPPAFCPTQPGQCSKSICHPMLLFD